MLHLHFKPDFDPSNVVDAEALRQFRFEWPIYQKLVQANAICHREISGLLTGLLNERFVRPFRFLDLACGDSSLAHTVLAETHVAHYEGLDLSEPALQCAAQTLADVSYEVELDEEDMVEGVRRRTGAADVIWCGLSIHHLETPQKLEMFENIRTALKPGGMFICYEPVLAGGETLEAFMQRQHVQLRSRFSALSEEEYDHIWAHIETCDLPESPEVWMDLGREAGFSDAREIFRMPGDPFCCAYCYEL